MRIFKSHSMLKLANSYLIDSAQPSNLNYAWNFGSLLAVCLGIQIVTGVTLAMHFNPSVAEAFNSIEHIMRDVNNGWLLRYFHSNTASAFFFLVYLHIGRGLYYGSYQRPRGLTWTIGTIILILMMGTAFLGYVLPFGQMSLWGATVITNLMSAIPWVGQDIVEFLWGGFSVNNATLNRFFALHFVLPFVLAALVLMHLIALHDSAGSSNPLGISSNVDKISMSPYYLFKDLITLFLFILVLSTFVFFMPNALGDSENYVMANPMQTPPAIVPEWYLLPFYAILRSIPNKLLGVIAMFSALLALLVLPYADLSRTRGIQFKPLSKISFFIFVANFIFLMVLGAKHVESPFIELGMICTSIYFLFYLLFTPLISVIENTLFILSEKKILTGRGSIKSTNDKAIKKASLEILIFIPSGGLIYINELIVYLIFYPIVYLIIIWFSLFFYLLMEGVKIKKEELDDNKKVLFDQDIKPFKQEENIMVDLVYIYREENSKLHVFDRWDKHFTHWGKIFPMTSSNNNRAWGWVNYQGRLFECMVINPTRFSNRLVGQEISCNKHIDENVQVFTNGTLATITQPRTLMSLSRVYVESVNNE